LIPLKRHLLPVAALWTVAFLAYANSFRGGLIFDSVGLILEDARLSAPTAANLHRILTEDYWSTATHSGLYRPLTKLAFLVNSGDSPASYHWFNFLIHAVNITLLYLLGLALLGRTELALLWAALWGLHPVLTESVTNVAGRADLLAGFAVLAGLLCHIRGWRVALAAVATIGIFSKESAVVLVAAMALYDIAFRRRDWRSYISVAIPFGLFVWARSRVFHGMTMGAFPFTDNPIAGAGFSSGRLTALKVIGRYLGLLLWPAQLSCDYSYNEVALAGWGDFGALLSLAVVVAAAIVALYQWRRRPLVFFCAGLFFAALAPTSNLIVPIGSIMAERFLYVPAIGFAGCAVVLLGKGWGRWLLAAACLLLAVRTYTRNNDWSDERSLWASAVVAAPDSYKTHMSAAGGLPLQAAAQEMDRALAIVDPLPDARNVAILYINAGGLFRDLGDAAPPAARAPWYRRSLETLERAERIQNAAGSVRWYQLYEELAATWQRLGNPERAAANCAIARQIAPAACK
jgi:hypothetical protein